ncbi:MAG TPA: zinc-binding dehydrogenase, partial [Solirubrobacter sp.]|nr:zinc-binding dehydrogenase [Solirubrobacter sp.]
MRAIWLREFGPPSVLEPGEAPEPDGGPLIEVAYANITFVETQVRAGRAPFEVTLPMIPGNGVGGYLDGRRVVASLGGSGGYAERAVGVEVFDVPKHRSLEDAVALLADGRTATLLADAAAIAPGERVLVLAAAGGVGTLLVQLAAAAGAHVIAAASTEAKREVARSLGAAETCGYDAPPPAVDVVFDGVGG